jgi:hypothetical protein
MPRVPTFAVHAFIRRREYPSVEAQVLHAGLGAFQHDAHEADPLFKLARLRITMVDATDISVGGRFP